MFLIKTHLLYPCEKIKFCGPLRFREKIKKNINYQKANKKALNILFCKTFWACPDECVQAAGGASSLFEARPTTCGTHIYQG